MKRLIVMLLIFACGVVESPETPVANIQPADAGLLAPTNIMPPHPRLSKWSIRTDEGLDSQNRYKLTATLWFPWPMEVIVSIVDNQQSGRVFLKTENIYQKGTAKITVHVKKRPQNWGVVIWENIEKNISP